MENLIEKVVAIPAGLQVEVADGVVKVSGSSEQLERKYDRKKVKVEKTEESVKVSYISKGKTAKKYANTIAAHIRNMMVGLTQGYLYKLQAVHSHFPMSIAVKGNLVEVNNFLGAKNPKRAKIVQGVNVEVKDKDITVTGFDKEAVGQTASNLEKATRVKGRDIRRFQDGIYLIEKGAQAQEAAAGGEGK